MATLHGPLKISGKIDGLTFYKTSDGYKVRSSRGISSARIKKAPQFARMRENMQEFGQVTKGNKLLRIAFRKELLPFSNKGLAGRLTKELMKVIRTDVASPRGRRILNNGDFSSLRGFEFNDQCKLGSIMSASFTSGIDAKEGRLWIEIPSFIPGDSISVNRWATHFKIISAAAEIDFENESHKVERNESDLIGLGHNPTPEIHLSNLVTPNAEGALFLVFGILFFTESGDKMDPLAGGAAMQLIGACNE